MTVMFTALSIAGSDPSGGAGVQGDLKTFARHGVYGMAVITAVTVQNTCGVRGVHDVPAEFVREQLEAVLDDMPVGAAKTGMFSLPETLDAVAGVLQRRRVPHLVVDPVMAATSGDALLRDDTVERIRERMLPLATLVTPNIPEAERLTGLEIASVGEMHRAARALRELGAKSILLTGGHLEGGHVVDLLHSEGAFHELSDPRIPGPPVHGTGCALAAAITAHLARGMALMEAVAAARAYVRAGIEGARALGKGAAPINHLATSGSGSA